MLPKDKKIMIVDDDVYMRTQLKDTLIKFGATKISDFENATDAKKALVAAYELKDEFHLILCDHHMPENTGLDFINYIRGSIKFKNIAFVTLTSDAQRSVVLPYLSAGSDAFIVKPYNEQDLLAKILQVFHKRGVLTA